MRYLLHHLLEDAARHHPDGIAVSDRGTTLTYRDLDEASSRLSSLLHQLGVRRGDRVGMYLDKSADSVVAVYGIMKAGAAYVPFDPGAPVARLAYIAGNCGITCLVTGTEKADQWSELVAGGAPIEHLVVVNDDDPAAPSGVTAHGRGEIAAASADAPDAGVIDQDLAYILYTSGSTGDPKGVMLTHRNALAFVSWAAGEFGIGPDDRLSSHAPLHFDLSVFDLYAAAHGAATVVLVPAKTSVFPTSVARFIADEAITVWYSVPSILTMLTLRGGLKPGSLPSLRTILFAGEVFPTKFLRALMDLLPGVRFANLYGPTETNVCTWYDVPTLPVDDDQPIPIGVAVENDDAFAVTDDGGRAQVGQVGELLVRGATVMRGYWGDPERTARGLVPDPFGGAFQDPCYRTGDLVEVLEGGAFRYVGRRDAQVKSRGYRIELGDVEAALYSHPAVVECAVVAVPDELVTNRLVAFAVVREDCSDRDLIQACEQRLPRYMVPESFTFLPALPKTSTGKIDRRGLAG